MFPIWHIGCRLISCTLFFQNYLIINIHINIGNNYLSTRISSNSWGHFEHICCFVNRNSIDTLSMFQHPSSTNTHLFVSIFSYTGNSLESNWYHTWCILLDSHRPNTLESHPDSPGSLFLDWLRNYFACTFCTCQEPVQTLRNWSINRLCFCSYS